MALYELHQAAKRGDLDRVRQLLSQPLGEADMNQPDHKGWTALMYAVSCPESGTEVLRTLIRHGVNIDQTSVSLALSDLQKLAVLIEAGANIRYQERGYDALIGAACGRDVLHNPQLIEILQLLIANGVSLRGMTSYGESGIRVLSRIGRFDAVQMLLKAGANPDDQRNLTRAALARLLEEEIADPEAEQELKEQQEAAVEIPIRLNDIRLHDVLSELQASGARRVLDLGCGEARLIREMLKHRQFEEIAGMDVSYRSLEIAGERLHLETMPPMQRERIKLMQGSLMYRDKRLAGFDAAAVVEVIEHLDGPRLSAFERVLFEFARPETIIVTTPNVEYNVTFPTMAPGQFRHRDHRFEWTREQFQTWGRGIGERFGYKVVFKPIDEEDQRLGSPTQMGVFSLA